MQCVAAEVGFSETVFAAPHENAWRVRYFAPELEVPFCGHARGARKDHCTGLVKASRRQVVQSLVRPLMVEHLSEPVELSLLQPQGQGWRVSSLLL